MFLSTLVLTGFKSYSERVEVNFGPKIAVIIGSNGVGKSNALDGIAWALGEEDLHVLRCRGRADLFFSGSQITPPSDKATIELTFEDGDAIYRFSRSLHRSGNELFTVDDKRVNSVAEYKEALDSLGIGTDQHNVIRQEELTDFFTKTPHERKSYLQQYVSSETDLHRVNAHFEGYLRELIPASRARIVSWDGKDGLDVEVTFPDKGVKWGVMLSGGGKGRHGSGSEARPVQSCEEPYVHFGRGRTFPRLDQKS